MKTVFIKALVVVLFLFTQNIFSQASKLHGPFFGLQATDQPQILGPDFISSNLFEINGTFSNDGKLFFYTSEAPGIGVITYCEMRDDGSWTEAKAAPFKSEHTEYDPLFAPTGNRLYYSSERPIDDSTEGGKSNIWYVDRLENGWTKPKHIPLTDKPDYYSSTTLDGKIYFNVWDDGELYKATPSDTGYVVERLPDVINGVPNQGRSDAGDPFIAKDESYIIFRGYKNTMGRGDLYISFNNNGVWTEPKNLGAPINSSAHEMCPLVTPDGSTFIFASARIQNKFSAEPNEPISAMRKKYESYDNGQLNIYFMNTDFIEKFRE